MTDFVLEQNKLLKNAPDAYDQYCKMVNYANFLKQPLKLEMFVPCDRMGYFFKKLNWDDYNKESNGYFNANLDYESAKEKVLFKGFEFFDNPKNCLNNMLGDYGVFKYGDGLGITTHQKGKGYHSYFCIITIEDLIRIEKGILLTQNAIKQLGL